jgi:ATP-binding cassette subfamily B protein
MEKRSDDKKTSFFKALGEYITPYRGNFALSIIISLLAVICGLAVYGVIGALCGEIFEGGKGLAQLLPLIIIAGLCKILNAVFLNLSTYISHKAAFKTLRDIRLSLSDKLMRLPLGYFERKGSGRLKTILVDRVEEVEKTLAHFLPEMTANLCVPIGLIIWMFFIDFRLALCVLLWIIIGLAASSGMMKDYDKKFAGQIAAGKNMNQAVVEYVGGIEVIKTFNQAETSYEKYANAVKHHASYSVDWMKSTQIFSSLSYSIAPVSIFGVLIFGLIFYGNGTLEPSILFLFMIISLGVFGPISKASSYMDQLSSMNVVAGEIKDILDAPELERSEQGADVVSAFDIVLNHITFSYEQGEKPAVKDISATIPQNTMFALVGPSGSGKSTIAKLLAGYWDTDQGTITIGGTPIKEMSIEQLNSLIAYVDQDTYLYEMSIMENIRIACPEATDEEVMEVCKKTGCHDFISKLPNGYFTQAGVAGNRLSGGEKQRIAIARAMMKNAPIMILDEATASSDPENEVAIQAALAAVSKNKTLIVVAHKLRTIMNADQIAFVEGGQLLCTGTHEVMLKNCVGYKKLWDISNTGGDVAAC